MRNQRIGFLVQAALIAALYVVLTFISAFFGLASGTVQIRLSEALAVLPFFTPAAIPGLFVGCLTANILTGSVLWDVLLGSLATLIGALCARAISRYKYGKWLVPLPNIIANTIIVPFVLTYAYGVPDAMWFLMLTVGAGEIISCGVLGIILIRALEPKKEYIFGKL